jgi:signal peptidase II
MKKSQEICILLFIFFIVFISDFYSKQYIKDLFLYNKDFLISSRKIFFFLDLTPSCNSGISFSFLKNLNVKLLIIFTGMIIFILFLYLIYLYILNERLKKLNKASKNSLLLFIGFIMILGGACANFFDRLNNGCVFDFLDLNIFNINFFIFNIADFYIFIGFVLIIIHELFKKDNIISIQ